MKYDSRDISDANQLVCVLRTSTGVVAAGRSGGWAFDANGASWIDFGARTSTDVFYGGGRFTVDGARYCTTASPGALGDYRHDGIWYDVSGAMYVTLTNDAGVSGTVKKSGAGVKVSISGVRVFDFVDSEEQLDSSITFTRATSSTRFDRTGALATCASGVARRDYNPSTLSPLGLMVEPQRTNLVLNSLADGTSLSTQGVSVTAQAYTLSFFGTGTVTLSGASTAGPLVGTGATNKVSLTFTPSAGTLTLTVSGTVKWANLEAGSFATSFIPTGGASATRNADDVVVSSIPWFNATEGTVVFEGDVYATTTDGTARVAWSFSDGTFDEVYYTTRGASSAAVSAIVRDGAVAQVGINSGNVSANTAFRIAFAYKVNDFSASLSGAASVTDSSGTLPTVTGLTIGNGNWSGASSHLSGHIRRLAYYNTRLTNAQLQALSTL